MLKRPPSPEALCFQLSVGLLLPFMWVILKGEFSPALLCISLLLFGCFGFKWLILKGFFSPILFHKRSSLLMYKIASAEADDEEDDADNVLQMLNKI